MCAAVSMLAKNCDLDEMEVYIFLDILSIPQKNLRQRQCAIESLGCFSSVFPYFVIIAPTAKHSSGKVCDKMTYARRGWCAHCK